MTRIGVLSDTHIASMHFGGWRICALIEEYLSDVSLLLHAGDIIDPDLLAHFAPRQVLAVRGNLDPALPDLPHKRVIEVEGFRIGLIHGWGAASGLIGRLSSEFSDAALDCLVFGHSHEPLCERRGKTLFFNPGSPTDRRSAPFHSIGLLEIDTCISGRIIRVPDPDQGEILP